MIKAGLTGIDDIQVGNQQIAAVYAGNVPVWQARYYGVQGVTTSPSDFLTGVAEVSTERYECEITGDNGDGTYNFEYKGKIHDAVRLFFENTTIKSITTLSIPKTTTNMSYSFYFCTALAGILDLAVLGIPPLQDVRFMFVGTNDTGVSAANGGFQIQNLKKFITNACVYCEGCLNGCYFDDLDFSEWDTSSITDGLDLFSQWFTYRAGWNSRVHITFGSGCFNMSMPTIKLAFNLWQNTREISTMLNCLINHPKTQDENWQGQTILIQNHTYNFIQNTPSLLALAEEAGDAGWAITLLQT